MSGNLMIPSIVFEYGVPPPLPLAMGPLQGEPLKAPALAIK